MRIIEKQEVQALRLEAPEVAEALREAFMAGASGAITWKPKTMLAQPDGAFLMATFAAWPARGLGLFHTLAGATADAVRRGSPSYRSRQLLTEHATGDLHALIDGAVTSAMLPAGVTRLMTARLARADSRVATIIGAGEQARVNLAAMDGIRNIQHVRIIGRSASSTLAFAEWVRARGQQAQVVECGPAAFEGADIVVSTVPASPGLVPFLEPAWVRPGTFVNTVDLGRSWKPGFAVFDRTVVDDRAQAEAQVRDGRMLHTGPYDSEISDVLGKERPGRVNDAERIVLIHPGNVVGVMGLTALIARRLGIAHAN